MGKRQEVLNTSIFLNDIISDTKDGPGIHLKAISENHAKSFSSWTIFHLSSLPTPVDDLHSRGT